MRVKAALLTPCTSSEATTQHAWKLKHYTCANVRLPKACTTGLRMQNPCTRVCLQVGDANAHYGWLLAPLGMANIRINTTAPAQARRRLWHSFATRSAGIHRALAMRPAAPARSRSVRDSLRTRTNGVLLISECATYCSGNSLSLGFGLGLGLGLRGA